MPLASVFGPSTSGDGLHSYSVNHRRAKPQEDQPEGKQVTQAAAHNGHLLTYLITQHDNWLRLQDTFGDAYNCEIVRLVMIGKLEGRPYDLSALASAIRTSRQQATRRCLLLQRQGWIEVTRMAQHLVLRPTVRLIEELDAEVSAKLPGIVGKWKRVVEAIFPVVTAGEVKVPREEEFIPIVRHTGSMR